MKLTLEQIKSITLGAVDVWEENGSVCFCRFNRQQMEMYRERRADFYKKAHSTAGVKLQFRTDSKTLSMKVQIAPGSSRDYFSVDVFADGKYVGGITELPDRYLGDFSGEVNLGEGEKTVTVYLPWSMELKLQALCLEEGASVAPVRPAKTLLIYGDSITQGYDARNSYMRYAGKLAAFLDAQEHNRAIGGEVYYAELAKLEGDIKPDYVAVAYGTNDWSKESQEGLREQCRGFVKTISEKYPQAQIFVMTPIWRKDFQAERPFGDFQDVEKIIRECCQGLSNVQVVRGFDFVPKDESYYADLRLHPNDEGFRHYAQSLCKAIAELIEN